MKLDPTDSSDFHKKVEEIVGSNNLYKRDLGAGIILYDVIPHRFLKTLQSKGEIPKVVIKSLKKEREITIGDLRDCCLEVRNKEVRKQMDEQDALTPSDPEEARWWRFNRLPGSFGSRNR